MSEGAPETSEILAFVKVVDEGSVSGAARELALPRATISRRLSRLEGKLGVRLLHRTTRQMNLTESGEEYYRHARGVLQAVQAASAAVCRPDDVPRGLLRVSIAPLFSRQVRETLLTFVEAYPEVDLELIASTALLDLRARNIDVAWRAAWELDPDLVARKLFTAELAAVASPAYLSREGTPTSEDQLVNHVCLLGFERGERPATHWPLKDGGRVRVRGRLVANDLLLLRDAALRGLGIALLPAPFMAELVAAGELVQVLPTRVGAVSQIALVYPDRRLLKPAVRAFVDHVVAQSGDIMSPDAPGTTLS
jgi:DNA-binding transcriptional LysR family regulator